MCVFAQSKNSRLSKLSLVLGLRTDKNDLKEIFSHSFLFVKPLIHQRTQYTTRKWNDIFIILKVSCNSSSYIEYHLYIVLRQIKMYIYNILYLYIYSWNHLQKKLDSKQHLFILSILRRKLASSWLLASFCRFPWEVFMLDKLYPYSPRSILMSL